MVVTDDPALAEQLAFLCDHAMDPKRRYYHPAVGFNYRMTNIQAAIGCAQLEASMKSWPGGGGSPRPTPGASPGSRASPSSPGPIGPSRSAGCSRCSSRRASASSGLG